MVFTKFKNLLNPSNLIVDKYSINALVKTIVTQPSDVKNNMILRARLAYLDKYRYDRNLSQGERIMLSNLLSHEHEKILLEAPHLIYHSLVQESRLQIIPDENVFNTKYYKYGDFVNVNTEKSIEVKTFKRLNNNKIDDLIHQYQYNKRNSNFLFSLFYRDFGDISEIEAKSKLMDKLNINNDQLVIKPFNSLVDIFNDDSNIEKAIEYYNIPWSEYQRENNARLLGYLKELRYLKGLTPRQLKWVGNYIKLLELNTTNKLVNVSGFKYPYKDTTVLIEDKSQLDPLDSVELTPEEIMSDQRVIDYNDENKDN